MQEDPKSLETLLYLVVSTPQPCPTTKADHFFLAPQACNACSDPRAQ